MQLRPFSGVGPWMLLFAVFCCCCCRLSSGTSSGTVSFASPHITVAEDGSAQFVSVQIPFVREGGTSPLAVVTWEVKNSSSSLDFFSTTNSALLPDGATSALGNMIVINDAVPEGNETFLLQIVHTVSAEIGTMDTMLLTISASDEPFGKFQFSQSSLFVTGQEVADGVASMIELVVTRGPGTFGAVSVDYQVSGEPQTDLSPSSGQLTFGSGIASVVVMLMINDDSIPENDELFNVNLVSPQGGAVLASENTTAQVTIAANDSPLKFPGPMVEVDESNGSVLLTVQRGITNGDEVGQLDVETTVNYSVMPGSATAGDDFVLAQGELTFPSGSTSQMLSIAIVDDDIPEGAETFQVTLSDPSPDAVLSYPSTVMVVVLPNDNISGIVRFCSTDLQVISEDDGMIASFCIERTVGTLNDLVIAWSLSDSLGQLASVDFVTTSGSVVIPDGSQQVLLEIQAIDDDVPEVAEMFVVTIDEVVSGGGQLDSLPLLVAPLLVADSDDVYGVVEIDPASGRVVVVVGQEDVRRLEFRLTRGSGSLAEISVVYCVLLLPPGVTDPSLGLAGTATGKFGVAVMSDGVVEETVAVDIYGHAFLAEGDQFYVELNSTTLNTAVTPLVMPTLSPRIGPGSVVTATVPAEAANGYISFDGGSLVREVEEPTTGTTATVVLDVMRTGNFGEAVVTWSVAPTTDIAPSSAMVTIGNGNNSNTIEIFILADDEPELAEAFEVSLIVVSPGDTQMLASAMTTATITILKNDNPEGVFQFVLEFQGPNLVEQEDSGLLQVGVERVGGNLTTENILYHIVPAGTGDFFAPSGILTFYPGDRLMHIILATNPDDVPEANETFSLEISSSSKPEIVGSPSAVSITILANDDWNGVFSFDDDSLDVIIDEPVNPGSQLQPSVSTANLTIQRGRGLFGHASVYWRVTSAGPNVTDISPSSGEVQFGNGTQNAVFQINAVHDLLTEADISYTVSLMEVIGGGKLDTQNIHASLTVRHNDDPISFASQIVSVDEGSVVSIAVVRGNDLNGVAVVTFHVMHMTAGYDDVVVAPENLTVTFADGEDMAHISVTAIQDDLPELKEEIQLELISVTGDAVINPSSSIVTVTVEPSDDPLGVFLFDDESVEVSVNEGENVSLIVLRERGNFSDVIVQWEVFSRNMSNELAPAIPQEDFEVTVGSVLFQEGQTEATIDLVVIADSLPELAENFEVHLVQAMDQGNSFVEPTIDLEAANSSVTIRESNDPYGLFGFSSNSLEIEIAEDVPVDNSFSAMALLNVTRAMGTFGTVSLLWQVVPASSPSLPTFVDLLLVSDYYGNGVTSDSPRLATETPALAFSGTGAITIPDDSQPHINGAFSISVWVKLANDSDGALVAKSQDGGSTIFYGVEVSTESGKVIIQLLYLPSTMTSGYEVLEESVPQSFLPASQWHSVIVTAGEGTAKFYANGQLQSTRNLASDAIADGVGELTVGGRADGEFFAGSLQDVRVYSEVLSQEQVAALSSDAAATDISPITGVLTFSPEMTVKDVQINALSDSIPEPSEVFYVQLADIGSLGRIDSSTATSLLTVLKSDSANGVFALSPDTLDFSTAEGDNVTVIIERSAGTFGSVLVQLEVRLVSEGGLGEVAVNDFSPSSAQANFTHGQTMEILTFVVVDEMAPEFTEKYAVVLASATPQDGYPSSTNTSGAWINASLSQATVTVAENDHPYGVMQFSAEPPAVGGNDIVPSIDFVPGVSVMESDGSVTVYVVRAQGTAGDVQVDFATEDGTAISTGIDADYIPAGGELYFEEGVRVRSIQLQLLDDSIPEQAKYFFLNMSNPSGDPQAPVLGPGSSMVITILPSDDAAGVFAFAADSLALVVEEEFGGTPVTLTVLRNAGTFGDVSVYWEVKGSHGDITPGNGYVNFTAGETEGLIELTIADDQDPEVQEVFHVVLVSASGGGRVSSEGDSTSIITITGSDYPYGLFSFSPAFDPLTVSEDSGNITVTVTREFGTEGTVQVAFQSLSASEIGLSDNTATENVDFVSVTGFIIFDPNVTSRSFTLEVVGDDVPELDERLVVVLTSAVLVGSSDVPPAISDTAGNATIIIESNDDPHGVIEFATATFHVAEGDQFDAITVTRTAGLFGEVSVSWQALTGTASESDFFPPSGTDSVAAGDSSTSLTIQIDDDGIPEFEETFSVLLTSVSGGARLGNLTEATVIIERSDDPNGVFVILGGDIDIKEPESQLPSDISLSIVRTKGNAGLSEVYWTITDADGSSAASDVQPTMGSVFFPDSHTSREFVVSVLPDAEPEVTEVFNVTLINATGGARIGDESTIQIRILPNDRPYGDVSLAMEVYAVTEEEDDYEYDFTVVRSGGTFGDLTVTYRVSQGVPLQATESFDPPISNIVPMAASTKHTTSSDDVANECAVTCAVQFQTCKSFVVDTADNSCEIFTVTVADGNITRMGVLYYQPIPGKLKMLALSIATPEQDFELVSSQEIEIPEGQMTGLLPVTIFADDLPELNETLSVSLVSAQALGVEDGNPDNQPTLVGILSSSGVIVENDNAYGRFVVTGTNMVPEPDGNHNLSVTLTVRREAGTHGNVQVTWTAKGVTASVADFSTDESSMAIFFADGETLKTIELLILGDDIPERDEVVRVFLVSASGGAVIATGDQSFVDVVIEANDGAAGTFGFELESRQVSVMEGETVSLTIERSISQEGQVEVYWNISGPSNVTQDFLSTYGSVVFEDDQTQATIVVTATSDLQPELGEEFTLSLTSVISISEDVGEGAIDPLAGVAQLSVPDSDFPHGVVCFHSTSASVTVDESAASLVNLTIVRGFGSIGAIRVHYRGVASSFSSVGDLAVPGQDFKQGPMTVDLADGQMSMEIPLDGVVLDDMEPELQEVFLINITSVHLISDPLFGVPLCNASNMSSPLAQIIISPSDNPHGRINFASANLSNISEGVGVLEVELLREAGTFGPASVFYFITSLLAVAGEDFDDNGPAQVSFADGESSQFILIPIIDDLDPELDETLEISLFSPSSGTILGNINTTIVTIAANDDPYGVIGFANASLLVVIEEAEDSVTDENVAVLMLVRKGGAFGPVSLPYEVEALGLADLAPASGQAVFGTNEHQTSIILTSVMDDVPELDETYAVSLGMPVGGATLDGNARVAAVTILENDHPFGVFEIVTANGPSEPLSVEEDAGNITFVVTRSQPAFGNATVTFLSANETAVAIPSMGIFDFQPVNIKLDFPVGVASHIVTVGINNEKIPEINETFLVALQDPSGGAVLSATPSLEVTILSNDNAHGVIGFDEDSISLVVTEAEQGNETVVLNVRRDGGAFGQVRVAWQLTGDHDDGEITESSGMVIFPDGVSSPQAIVLYFAADGFPELAEESRVQLTQVVQNGVPEGGDPSRGATIAQGQDVAFITVGANDAPHGVVLWSPSNITSTEVEGEDASLTLTLVREFGTIGDIVISFSTQISVSLPLDEQATPNQDFVVIDSETVLLDGETSATVNVIILHDDIPELTEQFEVVITSVQLVNESAFPDSSLTSPHIAPGQESVVVSIAENDNSRGVLNILGDESVEIQENVVTYCVAVNRTGGTFGIIGTEFTISSTTAIGGGVDYTPTSGSIDFVEGESLQCIYINITNDLIPEDAESLLVSLTNPSGGAQFGQQTSVTVTIAKNDDYHGAFSLTADSVVVVIPEGDEESGSASLTIQRAKGTAGEVTIYWEVSQDGQLDLVPYNGTVIFPDGVTEVSFQIQSVDDGLPELAELHTLTLISASGGGRIAQPDSAFLSIPASNAPFGVVALAPYPLDAIVVEEGSSFTVRITRVGGLFGSVFVSWEISPADITTFVSVLGQEELVEGQAHLDFTVQTIQDGIAEVARQFTLQLVGASQATVNQSADAIMVIVAASDDPHGVVQFTPPLMKSVSEESGVVEVVLQRNGGLVGALLVNFTAEDREAFSPSDYAISSNSVVIPNGQASAVIPVTIIDDSVPEVEETFVVTLLSVELASDIHGGRDFEFAGDVTLIDSEPYLGSDDEVDVAIALNDDANGVLKLSASLYNVEEGSTLQVKVLRSAGTFGTISVAVVVTPGSATGGGNDYVEPNSPLVMAAGQDEATVFIAIVQDQLPELQESFSVTLSQVEGGAILGDAATAVVFIAPSDDPNGRLQFADYLLNGVTITNPTVGKETVELEIVRVGGAIGNTELTWEVNGPQLGMESMDVTPTQGTVLFSNGQKNSILTIEVLPTSTSEVEEHFIVSMVTASQGVLIDPDASSVVVTVTQHGMPYGVVGFYGEALMEQVVMESELESQSVYFPLARTEGTVGGTEVFFVVSTDDTASYYDITPANGSIMFNDGQSFTTLEIQVLPDAMPEHDETFAVSLTGASGGTTIDPALSSATFLVRANDAPFGSFGVVDASFQLLGDGVTRELDFTITRMSGNSGVVQVQLEITYEEEPLAGYLPGTASVTLLDGQTSAVVTVTATADSFLAPGAYITINVTNVTLLSSEVESSASPRISTEIGSLQLAVPEDVSNCLVGFDEASLEAAAIDGITENNVQLTITRQGSLGNVQVSWTTGLLLMGVANGSLTPPTGSFLMTPDDMHVAANFTATPIYPPTHSEVFAVVLSLESLSPLQARVRVDAAVAVVEPRGVIRLAYSSYSGVEGDAASINITRFYGSQGDIVVTGEAKTALAGDIPANQIAAVATSDFLQSPVSVVLLDGQTDGSIIFPLPQNSETSPLKVFRFILTSVERYPIDTGHSIISSSPRRFISNQNATVTIIDDENGSGIFGFAESSKVVLEDGSPSFDVTVVRSVGSEGTVVILVMVSDGRADGTMPINQTAMLARNDYSMSKTASELTFSSGETEKTISIQVLDDQLPEIDEYFTITLVNPQGGAAIFNQSKKSFEVTIAANDKPGGTFSFGQTFLLLDEAVNPQGNLTVYRSNSAFGIVTVEWLALYTTGQVDNVAIGDILEESISTITFLPFQEQANVTLRLKANQIPMGGVVFTVRIRSDDVSAEFGVREAVVTAIPITYSVYQLAEDSRYVVANAGPQFLTIERTQGLQLASAVIYRTVQPSQQVTVGQLSFQPAQSTIHFTEINSNIVSFGVNQQNATVAINFVEFDESEPRAFFVEIVPMDPINDVVEVGQAIVLMSPSGVQFQLYTDYFNSIAAPVFQLGSIADDLVMQLQSSQLGADQQLSDIVRYTVEQLINRVQATGYANTGSLQPSLLAVFNQIVSDSSFVGQYLFVNSIKLFGRSLLMDTVCASQGSTQSLSASQYHLQAVRAPPEVIPGWYFNGSDGDFLRLPTGDNVFRSSQEGVDCLDLVFVEFFSANLFATPVFNSKVFSIAIQSGSVSVPFLNLPLTYRVHSVDGVSPSGDDCLIWQYPSTEGSSTAQWVATECTSTTSTSLQVQDYIECSCEAIGDYAAAIPVPYGWTVPGPVSCGFVVLVMVVVVLLHIRYFLRLQISTRVLITLCITIFIFEIMAGVDMIVANSVSETACVVIGAILQFTVLTPFFFIFLLVISLWINLMGLTEGKEPLIVYQILGWGLSVAVVAATILVGLYGAGWEFNQLYGSVGDFCFMPSAAGAGVSTGLPIAVLMLLSVGFVSHSCVYWSRWEDYKSLYRDTFNRREVPLLLVLFLLVFMVVTFGALHMYLKQVYLFSIFVAFNVMLGIYTGVVYFLVAFHTLKWKHRHYPIKEEVEPVSIPEPPDFFEMGSFSGMYDSQRSLLPQTTSLPVTSEQEEVLPIVPLNVTDEQGTMNTTQNVSLTARDNDRGESSLSGSSASYNFMDSTGGESGSQMDNLLFALRTGVSLSQEELQPPFEDESQPDHPSGSEHLALRRISIADTHV